MFSVKISLVKGISISKTCSEFFSLKRSGDVECKIQESIVNARIKNVTKNFEIGRSIMLNERNIRYWGAQPDQIIRNGSLARIQDDQNFDHPELHPARLTDHVLIPQEMADVIQRTATNER